jgi:hypothetical protein
VNEFFKDGIYAAVGIAGGYLCAYAIHMRGEWWSAPTAMIGGVMAFALCARALVRLITLL